MRQNYERCLLDFENYLACGQVAQAPPASRRQPRRMHPRPALPCQLDSKACKAPPVQRHVAPTRPGARALSLSLFLCSSSATWHPAAPRRATTSQTRRARASPSQV